MQQYISNGKGTHHEGILNYGSTNPIIFYPDTRWR